MSDNLQGLWQIATSLGISAQWLKVEAKQGRIPHLKAGRKMLFDLPTVRECLRQRAACGDQPQLPKEPAATLV